MTDADQAKLNDAINRIVRSSSRKKLVVAGPGAGKTSLFKELLAAAPGDSGSRLVLTFVNNLKDDLDHSVGSQARVFTLHGYSQSLLRRFDKLRVGLSADFRCVPGLRDIVKVDWEILRGKPAPKFIKLMRRLDLSTDLDFYLDRGNYYDAVDFDDSVFRVYRGLTANPSVTERFDLVLIDEFQDFNQLEAAIVGFLGDASAIVVAGDDDQALYSALRDADWELIRSLYRGDDFESFDLPFCMRCPEVIVGAVSDVIEQARSLGYLDGRIDKPYVYYPLVKGRDSSRYPQIRRVKSSVQRDNANYFGKYIAEQISHIPNDEINEAEQAGVPVALVIAPRPYKNQVIDHLMQRGYRIDTDDGAGEMPPRQVALSILREEPTANIGWRLILASGSRSIARRSIVQAANDNRKLVDVIPDELRKAVLEELQAPPQAPLAAALGQATSPVMVKVTSFEGAKGLSAQHVFIVGLHDGDLPRKRNAIKDLEICRFVVGLTRTRKQCSLLYARNALGSLRTPSVFLSWIDNSRFQIVEVDAAYWQTSH